MVSSPLALLLVAAGLAASLTAVIRLVARHAALVAQPREDRWHRRPVPVLGGLAMVVALLVSLAATRPLAAPFWILAAVSLSMAAVGLIDDLHPLRPQTKLLFQILAAATLVHFDFLLLPTGYPLVNVCLTILWVVGMTNAFNLLDNMDGLCAGIAAITAGVRLVFFVEEGNPAGVLVSAALMGVALGFLVHNFNPARIFMGDSGSLFLGFFLAGLGLAGQYPYTKGTALVLLLPVLIFLLPIFDTTFVTLMRKLSGRPVSTGGRDHLSHRLVAVGLSERGAVLVLYAIAGVSGAIAILAYRTDVAWSLPLVCLFVVGLLLLAVYLGKIRVYREGEVPAQETGALRVLADFPYKRHVATLFLDLLLIVLAYYGAYLLRFEEAVLIVYQDQFLRTVPVMIFCQIAALGAVGAYRGLWRYTGISDLLRLLKAASVGTAVPVVVFVYVYRFEGFSRAVFILDWLLLIVLLGGSRLSFRLLTELLRAAPRDFAHVLIYGAGDGGELALRELVNNHQLKKSAVGFIDDDRGKHRTRIHGLPVISGIEEIGDVIRDQRVSEIIVSTEKLDTAAAVKLAELQRRHGVRVLRASIRFESN